MIDCYQKLLIHIANFLIIYKYLKLLYLWVEIWKFLSAQYNFHALQQSPNEYQVNWTNTNEIRGKQNFTLLFRHNTVCDVIYTFSYFQSCRNFTSGFGLSYYLDEPIDIARRFVNYCSEQGLMILYISGRRKVTTEDTRVCFLFQQIAKIEKWLQKNGYPKGEIYHRRRSFNSTQFKILKLEAKSKHYDILAHFGDRLHDDGLAALQANIQPYLYFYRVCSCRKCQISFEIFRSVSTTSLAI